jgi:hypothetical protein
MDDDCFLKSVDPVDIFVDEFSYTDVRENHCVAPTSKTICSELVDRAKKENVKYLPICIPCKILEWSLSFPSSLIITC